MLDTLAEKHSILLRLVIVRRAWSACFWRRWTMHEECACPIRRVVGFWLLRKLIGDWCYDRKRRMVDSRSRLIRMSLTRLLRFFLRQRLRGCGTSKIRDRGAARRDSRPFLATRDRRLRVDSGFRSLGGHGRRRCSQEIQRSRVGQNQFAKFGIGGFQADLYGFHQCEVVGSK